MDTNPHLVSFFIENLQNIAILVLIIFCYNFIPDRLFLGRKTGYRILVGILFSLAAIITFLLPSATGGGAPPGPSGLGINGILIPVAGYVGGILSAGIAAFIIIGVGYLQGKVLMPPDIVMVAGTFVVLFFLRLSPQEHLSKVDSFKKIILFSLVIAGLTVISILVTMPLGLLMEPGRLLDEAAVFMAAFLEVLVILAVIKSIDRKKESEFELLAYKDHLEALVQERTSDLERANLLLDATINSTDDGILVVDFEGNVRDYNTTAAEILGIPRKDTAMPEGLNLLVLIKNQITEQELLEHPYSQTPPELEQILTTTFSFRSGRTYEVHITPYRLRDEVIGRVVNFRDITEKKRTEEALKRYNQKLLLLSGVTRHDILNQLTALSLYLELARDETPEKFLAENLERMEHIVQVIQGQAEFTRDYQAIGLMDPVWLDPDAAFQRAYQQFPDSGIDFSSTAGGIEVFSDPLLERVFYNLIDNSIRHGEHVTSVRLSLAGTGEVRTLVYEDDGAGVAPDEKERIFERGVGKHTGLGMFLIREILSITGITISETGTPGQGARFEICLPPGTYRQKPALPG
jgi:PAS domain S-box-containing protein